MGPQGHQDTADTIVEAIEVALSGEHDIHTIILYGSAANGNLRDGGARASDVDLAVAAHERLGLQRRIELATRLGSAVQRDVDLVDLRSVHGLIVREILSTGRFLRRNPEFIAEKALELYAFEIFYEPVQRAARLARIRRFVEVDPR